MKTSRACPEPDSNSSRPLCRRSRTGARAPEGATNPLNNFVDDVTWTKGKHTITMGLNFRLQPEQHVDVHQCLSAVCVRRDRVDRAGRGHRYFGAKLSGGQAQQSESATGQSDGGDERFGDAAGHLERRVCHLSIQQERTGAAAGDAAAALVHRTYLRGLHWRRLSREPRADAQFRTALRKFPAAV